jgi:predicted nucleic acid-binding protein
MERNKEKIRVVIDTNILISALIKDYNYTAKLLKSDFLDLYYPEDGMSEIEYFRNYIISKREKTSQIKSYDYALKFTLESVRIIPAELYSSRIKDAYEIMKHIDEKDTIFLALALQLKCPLWSNDKHFKQQKLAEVYTTEKISKLLKNTSIFNDKQDGNIEE